MKMMFSSWHQIPCWASPASFWVCFGILSVTYEFSVDTIGCIYEFASCSMPIMLAGYVKMDNKDVLLQYPEEEAFFVVRKKSRTTGHRSATEKMVYFHQEECYVIWHLRKNRKKDSTDSLKFSISPISVKWPSHICSPGLFLLLFFVYGRGSCLGNGQHLWLQWQTCGFQVAWREAGKAQNQPTVWARSRA